MTDLLLFVLATIGMTKIIVDGKIAQPFREWVRKENPTFKTPKLIAKLTKIEEIHLMDITTCVQCCGFWSGIFCGLMILLPWWLIFNKLFLYACASSYICMLGSVIVDYYNALLYMEEESE